MMRVLTCRQTEAWDGVSSDIPAYIEVICDDESELPADATAIVSGFSAVIGSLAHVVSNQLDYEMQSDGTWVQKQGQDLISIINAISNIEDDLQDVTADASWAKTQVNEYIRPALISVINRGAKNVLNLESAITTTDNGVTFTVNPDFTITITGQAIAPNNGWFVVPITVPNGVYMFSGMPDAGGTSSYRQEIRATPRGSVIGVNDSASGNQITISSGGATIYYHIRAASGYSFGTGVTVKPMLSQPDEYTYDDTYVPYAPTNRELYELIRGYHP